MPTPPRYEDLKKSFVQGRLIHSFSIPWHEETELIKEQTLIRVHNETTAADKKKRAKAEMLKQRGARQAAHNTKLKAYNSKTEVQRLGMYMSHQDAFAQLFRMYAWRDIMWESHRRPAEDSATPPNIGLAALSRIFQKLWLGNGPNVLETVLKDVFNYPPRKNSSEPESTFTTFADERVPLADPSFDLKTWLRAIISPSPL